MTITGIEVIRRNPGVAIGVIAGEKIELTFGDTLRVNVSFGYRGLAQTVTLYGAIGNRGFFGFDEILHNGANIELPESPAEFTPCQASVDIINLRHSCLGVFSTLFIPGLILLKAMLRSAPLSLSLPRSRSH